MKVCKSVVSLKSKLFLAIPEFQPATINVPQKFIANQPNL
jgi:hypothetical protein